MESAMDRAKKWVLLFTILAADDADAQFARGLFLSYGQCMRFGGLINAAVEQQRMYRCMTEAEFRERFPAMSLDAGS
jgi:hypothetical protein